MADERKVEVAVVTTAGTYPTDGHVEESSHQKVDEVLKKAGNKLEILSTTAWIAKVAGREIDPAKTYLQNSLTGTFEIDWGPREGGGGSK